MASAAADWIENRPTRGRRALDWRELWRYRELVGFLAARDLRVRYKQAAFGVIWVLVQPLAALAVFVVIFGELAGLPSDGASYASFALVGLLLWQLFSGAINSATTSLVDNSALVTKVYFPRIAAPLASVLPRTVDFLIATVLLLGLLALERSWPDARALLAPFIAAWVLLLAFGIGLLLATIQVRYRDAHHGLTLLMQLWLYASPIVYPSSLVPESWRWVYSLNPLVGPLDAMRWALLGTPAPGADVWVSAAATIFALWIGVRTFVRSERRFADII